MKINRHDVYYWNTLLLLSLWHGILDVKSSQKFNYVAFVRSAKNLFCPEKVSNKDKSWCNKEKYKTKICYKQDKLLLTKQNTNILETWLAILFFVHIFISFNLEISIKCRDLYFRIRPFVRQVCEFIQLHKLATFTTFAPQSIQTYNTTEKERWMNFFSTQLVISN